MPKFLITKELEKGFCRVTLIADNGKSEEQTYQNDPDVLTAAAQHFDAEHKRVDTKAEEAGREDKPAAKVFEIVDVAENLDA